MLRRIVLLILTYSFAVLSRAQANSCGGLTAVDDSAAKLVYPAIAKAAQVQGLVLLLATLERDGSVSFTHVVSGPQLLQPSAIEFVKHSRVNEYTGPRTCPIAISFYLNETGTDAQAATRRSDPQYVSTAEVEEGEHLIVERRGVPVAEILPFRKRSSPEEREAAWQEMLAILERGIPMGGVPPTKERNASALKRYTPDANILVYALDPTGTRKHLIARSLWTAARDHLRILTTQALAEAYKAVSEKHSARIKDAHAALLALSTEVPVVSSHVSDFEEAMAAHRSRPVHFWDAMLWATAKRCGCKVIVTEHAGPDVRRGRHVFQSFSG